MASGAFVVPVIDLENFPAEREKLSAAVTDFGCFRVVNHGIPPALTADTMAIAQSLFQLPDEAKLRNVYNTIYNGGYMLPTPAFKFLESFGIYDAASPADVHSFCSALDTSAEQREVICECFVKLHGLIVNIACKMAQSLGFDLTSFSFEEWTCHARFHLYNFSGEDDIGCIGIPPHTDVSFLTVLREDECIGGLEIADSNGDFVAVDPVPGTFLVFVGDIGKAWSNGRLNNVKHRVVCKEARPRVTLPIAMVAPKNGIIAPEASFIDSENPRLYQTFIYNEYRKLRFEQGSVVGQSLPRF